MADLSIKPDPDAPGAGASPAAFSEEDIYEDAGDLEFNPDPAFQALYLAKVPKYVWEAWASLDDDAEIQIGTIRNTTITESNGEQKAWNLGSLMNIANEFIAIIVYAAILQYRRTPDYPQGIPPRRNF
jgi:hypothetical protein